MAILQGRLISQQIEQCKGVEEEVLLHLGGRLRIFSEHISGGRSSSGPEIMEHTLGKCCNKLPILTDLEDWRSRRVFKKLRLGGFFKDLGSSSSSSSSSSGATSESGLPSDSPWSDSPYRRYDDNRPMKRYIRVIRGGFESGEYSSSSRKRHTRRANGQAEEEVYNLSSPAARIHQPITFTNDDLRGLHFSHDDALVISITIANFNVQRILIDKGIGFGGNTMHPPGWIKLPVIIGMEPHQTTVWQNFIMMGCPLPYNAILGHPMLGGIKAITSTYHLMMKFLTSTRVGESEITLPKVETSVKQDLEDDLARWKLFKDESSNQHGCGVGLVLQTSSSEQIEYAIRIGFKATTNKAECEALLAGLRVASELGVESLDTFSDS
ncbi:hypothetical protein Acr_11g0007660 [Actinidia rufa]|uniref:RNase H type-1 domain-containing protein n=1 Tax=Actinidia rufa TaxID=165716 RepID=A0A7J0FCN6_9ERIC|nr:hypothetical protein Acr_11g0007660 [Actinidia rufa]